MARPSPCPGRQVGMAMPNYALRKTVVEPVFGQIRSSRRLNRFRLRGLEKVNGEWALMATTHNLLKLFRATMATA